MKIPVLALALLMASCTGTEIPGPAPVVSDGPAMSACNLHSPRDIAMWINAMPGPGASPTLISTFKAVAPTPGYTYKLEVREVKESYPPQYVFSLVATPPSGIVTQVETEMDIRVEIPNFEYTEIASATVLCAGKPLFSLESVQTAY